MAETQSTPTSNTEKAVAAVVVIAGIGGIIWGISSLAKDKASKVTVVLSPTSGAVGTVVSVTGTGWVDSETITSVIIGGIDTYNTLSVDSSGALSGSFTIPTLPGGNTTVLILGAKSTYTGTFLVVTAAMLAGFIILSSATLTVAHTTANPVGWLPLAGATLVVAHTTAIITGWVPLANFSLVVAHTTAEPVGWVGIANFSQIITHITPNPVGWLPLASISLSVAHSVVLTNPTISLTNNKLNQGDTLWYSLSGFAHGIQVTMSVSGYAIVVTTDVNGNYGPVNFPPTSSLAVGTYTLTATYGNGQSVTSTFSISAGIPLQITSDSNGFVDVIDLSTGLDITQLGTAIVGHTLQITAYAWNSNYQFAGWTDTYGILGPVNKMYAQVTITATSAGINLYANFVYVAPPPPPPPPPGGIFPAPGTKGDGQYWMYITFLPAYGGGGVWIGYNSYLDEYDPQDSSSDYYELASVQGPYASGATS